MADVETEVVKIIAAKAQLDPSKLIRSAKLTELNISSLDVVEIIFAIEELFDIQIAFNANKAKDDFESVADIVLAVETLVAQKA
ncbi:MAG: acyl carrier protein [Rhodospirillaceae bacterium]